MRAQSYRLYATLLPLLPVLVVVIKGIRWV
jgi:hypothetical protein